jgi:hypothetical protein
MMFDAKSVSADADPVKNAREYRAQLEAELAKVDAFITMAEDMSCSRRMLERGFWLLDHADVPATLH